MVERLGRFSSEPERAYWSRPAPVRGRSQQRAQLDKLAGKLHASSSSRSGRSTPGYTRSRGLEFDAQPPPLQPQTMIKTHHYGNGLTALARSRGGHEGLSALDDGQCRPSCT